MAKYLRRKKLAEKYGFSPQTITVLRREMEESGLFHENCFISSGNYMFIEERAFLYFMSNRKAIKAGEKVRPYKVRGIA